MKSNIRLYQQNYNNLHNLWEKVVVNRGNVTKVTAYK